MFNFFFFLFFFRNFLFCFWISFLNFFLLFFENVRKWRVGHFHSTMWNVLRSKYVVRALKTATGSNTQLRTGHWIAIKAFSSTLSVRFPRANLPQNCHSLNSVWFLIKQISQSFHFFESTFFSSNLSRLSNDGTSHANESTSNAFQASNFHLVFCFRSFSSYSVLVGFGSSIEWVWFDETEWLKT